MLSPNVARNIQYARLASVLFLIDPPAITSLSLQRCGVYSKDSTESGCLGKEDKMPTIVVRELQRGRQWKMDGALRRRLNAGYPRDRLRNRHMREHAAGVLTA
jgi:hypothetical protein